MKPRNAPPRKTIYDVVTLAVVLGMSYLVFTDTPVRHAIEKAAGAAPGGMQGAARFGLSLLAVVMSVFAFLLLALLAAWAWMRMTARRAPLAAYKDGTRQALERSRVWMEAELSRQEEQGQLSPDQIAALRKDFESVLGGVAEDAGRREQVYAQNPAMLEHDLQAAIENARTARRKKL